MKLERIQRHKRILQNVHRNFKLLEKTHKQRAKRLAKLLNK